MHYQISFLSPNGHIRTLAEAMAKVLPPDTALTDIQKECGVFGDVHLIGFEVNEANMRAVPYKIMELLDRLERKNILFFVTCPFRPDNGVKAQLERSLIPFLLEHCSCKGLFVCAGEASATFLENVRMLAAQRPEDASVQNMLASCEGSVGHPDEQDIGAACRFAAESLKLDV